MCTMSVINAEDVSRALTSLTKKELMQLKAQISFLLGKEDVPRIKDSADAELFYVELREAIKRTGRKPDSRETIEHQKNYLENFNNALTAIDELCATLPRKTKLNRVAITRWVLNITHAYLIAKGIPITMFHFAMLVGRLNEIIDYQFPGYIDTKLLPYLIKRVVGG